MAIKYTDLDTLKTYLSISDGNQDTLLTELITVATDMLDIELGDNLGTQTVTRRLDGTGTHRLVMENTISSVTTLQYSSDEGQTWNTIEVQEIDDMIVYAESKIPKGYKNVKITYVKGYDEAPKDLQRFFLMYVAKIKDLSEDTATATNTDRVKEVKIGEISKKFYSPSDIAELDKQFNQRLERIVDKYGNFKITVI